MEPTDERRLKLEIPPWQGLKAAPDPTWDPVNTNGNGWVIYPGQLILSWEGTIDLSGYARDMKTFYPAGALIQNGPAMLQLGGSGIIEYTVVSTIPLVLDEVITAIATGGGPGFVNVSLGAPLVHGQNWETVTVAESNIYVPNTNISPNVDGYMNLLSTQQSGSLEPTATDTLYVMRVIIPSGAALTYMVVPASRVIIPGIFGSEPDVEYMMRLKRSTELSQQV